MTKIIKISTVNMYGVAEGSKVELLDLCSLTQALLDSGHAESEVGSILDNLDESAVELNTRPIL